MENNRIIVISRQYGSGGSEIGRRLATELGIPYYDKVFFDKRVEDKGLSPAFMEEQEQKFVSSLLFSLATGGYHHSTDRTVADQVFIAENDALHEVARQGSCVVMGHCADYLLEEEYDVFSVFVHAPLSQRVKRAVEEYDLDPKRAERTVKDMDRSRARHYEYYTDRTWGDPNNYHLCVNSGRLGIEKAVQLIRQALELL